MFGGSIAKNRDAVFDCEVRVKRLYRPVMGGIEPNDARLIGSERDPVGFELLSLPLQATGQMVERHPHGRPGPLR